MLLLLTDAMDYHPLRVFLIFSLLITFAAVWITLKIDARREDKTASECKELHRLMRL